MVIGASSSWRAAFAAAAALGAVACGAMLGLNDYGDAPADAGGDSTAATHDGDGSSTPTSDGTAADSHEDLDGGTDAIGQTDGGGTEVDAESDAAVPPGWTLVAFSSAPDAGCPAGLSNALNVVFDTPTATPASNACACESCTVTAPPSCVTGSLTGKYDLSTSPSCTTANPTLANADAGGCNTDNPHTGISTLSILWNPLPATGGACTSSPTAHADRVTFANVGLLCAGEADAGAGTLSVPSPFLMCIAAPGNVPCPPGPLGVAHIVGTGATLSCSGTCTCSVSGTCRDGVVTYYKNSTCGGGALVMPADGGCAQVLSGAGFSNTYGSYQYTAALSTTGCSANGTPSATVTGLASEQTICCAQ